MGLQEEEDKKNAKEGGKNSSSSNSNKSKSVNAVAQGNKKSAPGKPAGKPSVSGSKPHKMGGMNNGICPVGKKLIDAPKREVQGCKDRTHWGWCDRGACAPCRQRHEVKAEQPGEPVGPEISKVRGRWTSHTEKDCRQKEMHREWKNEPAGAGTTSRTVGEISSNSSNNASMFNKLIQEQLQDQVDHEDMTWGWCLSTYPGKQEAGGQEPISRPCHAIAPPLQMEVGMEEVQLGERKTDDDAIQDDSDMSNPDEGETDPESLPEKTKQSLPEKVKQKVRRQKDREKSQNRARKMTQRETENDKEDLHEMAPGVPTGPGEEERGAGLFPGLNIQSDDDYRGMNRDLQKRVPPFVVPPFPGIPGSEAGGGPGVPGSDSGGGPSSHQNKTGLFSGPQNQQKENLNQTSGTQPGPGTVGQLQAGEQGEDKVSESINVHTLPLSNIPHNIRATMNKHSFSPLMPDSFKSMIYRYVKLGPHRKFIKLRLCVDAGFYFNVLPLALVEKMGMTMSSNNCLWHLKR